MLFRSNLTGVDPAVSPAPTFMVFNPLRTFVEVINPDTHGVGDLVVTVMDEAAPVPLLRYATGDRVQSISTNALPDDISPPNLPLIALHGRARDQLPGGGHVDLFKEALYRDPAVARQLSGAHRITTEGSAIRWEVQAVRGTSTDLDELASSLQRDLTPRLGSSLQVFCLPYAVFPYSKTIDFERKFLYWVPPKH